MQHNEQTPKMNHKNQKQQRLNESQLSYKVFIDTSGTSSHDIEKLFSECVTHLDTLVGTYIWNNEPFYLSTPIKCNDNSDTFYTCEGVLDFGDNLEDEWFVVHLLLKLTEKFPRTLVAQVHDSDGEFLLVHAANFLPDWASSAADDSTLNRVFLSEGRVHLIPPANKPSQITYLPASGAIEDALAAAKCVMRFSDLTTASDPIQQCVAKRLAIFTSPTSQQALYHRVTCTIPAKLAWLLRCSPALIAVAVNRFCEKDPADLKLCRDLSYFAPIDLVNYRVLFTKHLYGKLKYAEYKPERKQGWPTLEELRDGHLQRASMLGSIVVQEPGQTDEVVTPLALDRSNMGFKLTCAFEIMSKRIVEDKSTNKSFEIYKKRLENFGYFKDCMEHSKKYNELLETAKQSFGATETPSGAEATLDPSHNEPVSAPPRNYTALFESLYADTTRADYVTQLQADITAQTSERDDSDEWLCVEAPQLDDYLEMYSRGDVSSTYDFRLISNAFKRFLARPVVAEDLLKGAEFSAIDARSDEQLIDFNVDSIELNLKDLLKQKQTDGEEAEGNEDDESDSFYEIDEDLVEDANDEENLASYMNEMDEVLDTQKGLSRVKRSDDTDAELNLDLNLVTNALESYSAQLGMTGPISNILKSMGL